MFPTLFKHEVMCVISCVRISLVIGFGLAEDVIFFRYFFFFSRFLGEVRISGDFVDKLDYVLGH